MNQLINLFESSPFSVEDYAYLLGVTKRNLTRWLRDDATPPDDVIGRAIQIEADYEFTLALVNAHPNLSYKFFKYALDS